MKALKTCVVVHKAIIDKARTPAHLIKIDLDDKLNILSPCKLKLPTATIHLLRAIEQGKKLHFKTYCGLLLTNLLKKLQERSQLNYQLVRLLVCLTPKNMHILQ